MENLAQSLAATIIESLKYVKEITTHAILLKIIVHYSQGSYNSIIEDILNNQNI